MIVCIELSEDHGSWGIVSEIQRTKDPWKTKGMLKVLILGINICLLLVYWFVVEENIIWNWERDHTVVWIIQTRTIFPCLDLIWSVPEAYLFKCGEIKHEYSGSKILDHVDWNEIMVVKLVSDLVVTFWMVMLGSVEYDV